MEHPDRDLPDDTGWLLIMVSANHRKEEEEDIWGLVDMIAEEISILLETEKEEGREHYLQKSVDRLYYLLRIQKKSSIFASLTTTDPSLRIEANQKVIKMTEFGLALERKLYIDKLRNIEKFASRRMDDPLCKNIMRILTEENGNFELVDSLAR